MNEAIVCDIEKCTNIADTKIVISRLDGSNSSSIDYYVCQQNATQVMKCLKGDVKKIRRRLKNVI